MDKSVFKRESGDPQGLGIEWGVGQKGSEELQVKGAVMNNAWNKTAGLFLAGAKDSTGAITWNLIKL